MQHHRIVSTLLLFILLWVTACSSGDRTPEADRFPGEYIAHLQLDSTTLIVTELLSGLETPWNIMMGPDGWIWINEHNGTVSRVHTESGEHQQLLRIPDVHFERAQGLLSSTFHPDFEEEPHIFFHFVYMDEEENPWTRIVRYTFDQGTLVDRTLILDALPAARGHNGSRMLIGTDGKLWLGYGDIMQEERAQDPDTYIGKVLRMNLDGSVPEDNPFGNLIWSSGHRNIQGITQAHGKIYVSEHGPDNDDEVNIILKGRNYGWPDVEGYCESEAEQAYCRDSLIVEPLYSFTPVVAAAGIEYYGHEAIPEWQNSLLLTNLRIQALRVLHLDEEGEQVRDIGIYFQQYFGRLRDVAVGPDGTIYLATSNMDWYQTLRPDIHDPALEERGDRIIMIRPENDELRALYGDHENRRDLTEDRVALYLGDTEIADNMGAAEQLYVAQCASCHQADGTGMDNFGPPLDGSGLTGGDPGQLVRLVLNGVTSADRGAADDYVWDMPAFGNLDDEEIAAILNYIRGSFTDRAGHLTAGDVASIRSESQ